MYLSLHQQMLALQEKRITSVAVTENALDLASTSSGEGSRVFTRLYTASARAAAQASDSIRGTGLTRSPIDGLPISIKDLFDVAGETTLAGSVVLRGHPVAMEHAQVVKRLMAAGAVIIGRTNMTEFAFSGLGINPHYGTPRNPWDRETGRIPGGSSSGAAVSVSDGMAAAAVGSDTGGSVRIPAALCGLTGFKPTARRVPMQGVLPLSVRLDSIGPIAPTVACCAVMDAILAGEEYKPLSPFSMRGLRLLMPTNVVLDDMDQHVSASFMRAISRLSRAGAMIIEQAIPEFDEMPVINAKGGFSAAEAWTWHRELIASDQDRYDPRVVSRMLRGKDMSASDLLDVLERRQGWIAAVEQRLAGVDALIMPTVPLIAPAIAELVASDDAYFKANGLMLRNSSLINFLDGCALSIPCHEKGTAPVGLTLASTAGDDHRLLSIGLAIESALAAA